MSEENVEIFKRGVELWNRDDFDTWIELHDPRSNGSRSWRSIAGVPESGRPGRASRATCKSRFDSETSVNLGESVLALGEMESTGHTTGLNFTDEVAQLVTYRDGRIIKVRDFASHAEALEAAGLSE